MSTPVPKGPISLPGPTGEANTLEFHPRGVVACIAADERGLFAQAKAALASGNTVLLLRDPLSVRIGKSMSGERITFADELDPAAIDAVLLDVDRNDARRVRGVFAAAPGKIVPIVVPDAHGNYDRARLVVERTVTVNTSAAGGNAALLSLDEDAV